MENKTSCLLAIAAVILYVLPFFLSPFVYNLEKEDAVVFFVTMAILGGLSVVLAIAAVIMHRREEDTGWRSSIGKILGLLACCAAPVIVPFILPLLYFSSAGFGVTFQNLYSGLLITSGVLAIFIVVLGIRNYELKGRTVALIMLLPAFLLTGCAVFGAIFSSTDSDSCGPSAYSFNGEEFVFESEPYAGAILVERTCYTELKELEAAGGQYRIKIANELEETQYTDELKLLVVEHRPGTDVVCDYSGGIYTISSAVEPISAVEGGDIDILEKVSKKDYLFWEGDDSLGDRSELILEFAKPAGASETRLVVNVCNTQRGTALSARFLRSFGVWYPLMSAIRSYARKGFIRFEVQAWDSEKWVSMGYVRGANPEMPKDQVVVLDISEIAGERLKLRLLPASGFWRINSVAVDYTDEAEPNTVELEASWAITHDGKDVRDALKANDDNMYILEKGESATIIFEELPLSPGMERSFILKAAGYYVAN